MGHDRQPDFVGDLDRHVERRRSGIAAGVAADPHLDPDDQIAIGIDHPDAFARVDEAQIGVLADHDRRGERKDAGKRHVEVRQDAQRRRLDDMPPKAMEIAGTGAAGIDKRRRAAARRERRGVDPERGSAPIDMGVQVNEAGHDNEAARIDDLLPAQRQTGPDRRDPAVAKADIGDLVAPVCRIDDPAALEDEIQHRLPPYRGEPTQPVAVAKAARYARNARGGGRAFPQRHRTEATSPKAALTPSPRCRVNGRWIFSRATRCLNMLLPAAYNLLYLRNLPPEVDADQ